MLSLVFLLPLGCGREPTSVTAPTSIDPPLAIPDLSALPLEFAVAARELLSDAAMDSLVPLTETEAAQLLRDNDLSWRVSALTDRMNFVILNALKATYEATGFPWTHGVLRRAADGIHFTFELGDPRNTTLIIHAGRGPEIRVEFEAVDRAWLVSWVRSDGGFGLSDGTMSGHLAARVSVGGRLNLRIDTRYLVTTPENGYQPPRYIRRLSGWVVNSLDGKLELTAQTEGVESRSFHGDYYRESVTALVRSGLHRVLLSEIIEESGYFDPMTSRGEGSTFQRGFRLERLGSRVMTLPDLELQQYFAYQYFARVAHQDSWRVAGNFTQAGRTVAQFQYDTPPVDGTPGGPKLQLAREGAPPVPARELRVPERLEGYPDLLPYYPYAGRESH